MSTRRELDRWMVLGTDIVSWGTTWEIAGIGVDNPSGSWLLVSGIDQYVPPYTAGWRFPVKPKQAAVTVRFVNSPSGSLSTLNGTAPKLTISDQEYPPQQGTPTGAGSRIATVPDYIRNRFNIIATVAGVSVDLFSIPVGQRIIVMRIQLVADPVWEGTPGGPLPLSANVVARFFNKNTGEMRAALAISPSVPFTESVYEPGALFNQAPNAANAISATLNVEDGGANQGVILIGQGYYENL